MASGRADPKPLPSLLPRFCTTLQTWLRQRGGLAQGVAAAVVAQQHGGLAQDAAATAVTPSHTWLYDRGGARLLLEARRGELLDSSRSHGPARARWVVMPIGTVWHC